MGKLRVDFDFWWTRLSPPLGWPVQHRVAMRCMQRRQTRLWQADVTEGDVAWMFYLGLSLKALHAPIL